MSIKNILIITSGYPSKEDPTRYTFVDQLACSLADNDIDISVISPLSKWKASKSYSINWQRITKKGNSINVYEPLITSYSSIQIGPINTGRWTYHSFLRAVRKQFIGLHIKHDVIYSHFLFPSGCVASRLTSQFGIPSFCSFGESSLWSVNSIGISMARRELASITGIISVSTKNKRILIENELFSEEKIAVFPNGVNHELFYPRDKREMREKLGLPQDAVIGVYIGEFSERKGVLRVAEAARRIDGLKMLFIGSGDLEPKGSGILFKGKVPHVYIPEYLSAGDFFVLPSQEEGSCNAIIEAMACGLPIIASTGAFNDDILAKKYSIRVEANDIGSLEKAMKLMYLDHTITSQMSIAAREASKKFDIDKRAKSILNWMNSMI